VRLALIAIVLAIGGVARATPTADFDLAKTAYRNGQYQQALPLFNALLYPPPPKLASQEDLTDAYLALGVCRYETGDTPGAKREFEQALSLDPNSRIDPLIVTDPTAIQTFNETKLDVKKRLDEEAERKRRADIAKLRASLIGFEQNRFGFNFVPFGGGQFQNRDTPKGIFFATTEVLALGTSFGIFGYLVNKYGLRSTNVPREDGANVRFLQQIEIGSGIMFFGLYAYGVYDALRHYKPQVRAAIDEDLLPPELRDPDAKKAKKKPPPKGKTSLLEHLSPMLTPNGAGIGLSWEN
jgi:tetratricopeptide (TPR) repeat protein